MPWYRWVATGWVGLISLALVSYFAYNMVIDVELRSLVVTFFVLSLFFVMTTWSIMAITNPYDD
jgi:hypothetical protein